MNLRNKIDTIIVSIVRGFDKSRFGIKDKIFFFREIWYLLQGGVWLVDALSVIASSSSNYALKDMSTKLLHYVNQWKNFSYGLNRLPEYFTESDYGIIKIWEKSWNLAQIFQSLASEYAFLDEIKNKYISAMMYPILLVGIALAAVLSLFLLVLPNIFSIAEQFNVSDLPTTTRILKQFSDFLMVYRPYILWWLWVWGFIWTIYFSTYAGKRTWFNIVSMIPYFGTMTRNYYLIKRCRYMHLMLQAWMSYVQMFQLVRNVMQVPAYQDMLDDVLLWLEKWQNIYTAISRQSDIIPSSVAMLIKVWEQTAQLDKAIENVLVMYEDELNRMIDRLAKVIEPIMLVLIWWLVVVIALWVFGLILHIMEGVGM